MPAPDSFSSKQFNCHQVRLSALTGALTPPQAIAPMTALHVRNPPFSATEAEAQQAMTERKGQDINGRPRIGRYAGRTLVVH